jgi:hypothetical protein
MGERRTSVPAEAVRLMLDHIRAVTDDPEGVDDVERRLREALPPSPPGPSGR